MSSKDKRPDANEIKLPSDAGLDDPIGDETDGEGRAPTLPVTEPEIAAVEETAPSGGEMDPEEPSGETAEEKADRESGPAGKLERLQKILAQSGVASRRRAEEMIEQGRVQVNGQVVTTPGTKADPKRDHIRVDGKLLQGAERHRYFVLNKPKGYVTTVKDPEGRPTVMQFFERMRERLYPVGRLDYMSEGLLLVTNDGELANQLTRAATGVEKTYLVKVAGKPTEDELDTLRAGVTINKGKNGEGKVRTSPARIRQVRQGDNPWFEVVLIEGRNRELRKMFEEIGHFVEKIRRVGYGPLILDQEPGKMRELDAQELELLRKAAAGKLKTPKAKEVRRRNREDATGPEKPPFRKERGAGSVKRGAPANETFDRKTAGGGRRGKFKRGPAKFGGRPAADAPKADGDFRKKEEGWKIVEGRERPAGKGFGARPAGARPPAARPFGERPATGRSFPPKPTGGRPFGTKPAAGRSFPPKPAWKRGEERPQRDFRRPFTPRPETPRPPAEASDEQAPKRPFRLHIEPVQGFERGDSPAARPDRPRQDRGAGSGRPSFGRTGAGRSEGSRPQGRPSSTGRPFRPQGGMSRPFTTSSGKPRAGGARPSSKPAGRPGAQRPEGEARPERRTGTGWKPKPAFGGKSKPAGRIGAKPGGFSRPGSKGAPGRGGGFKRSGPRPGGKGPARGGKRG